MSPIKEYLLYLQFMVDEFDSVSNIQGYQQSAQDLMLAHQDNI